MNKLVKIVLLIGLMLSCLSCKGVDYISKEEYLKQVAFKSGIDENEETYLKSLIKWKIVKENEMDDLAKNLNYEFASNTISRLIDGIDDSDYLYIHLFTNHKYKRNDSVKRSDALDFVSMAVNLINNPSIDNSFDLKEKEDIDHLKEYAFFDECVQSDTPLVKDKIYYLENDDVYIKIDKIDDGKYYCSEASIEDVYDDFKIEGSFDLDFSNSEIVEYGDEIDDSLTYQNDKYTLLSNDRKKFKKEDFDISYSLKTNGIDLRISRGIKGDATMYYDLSLSGVKPSYKWNKTDEGLNAFLKVDFNLINEVGVTTGKYKRYYLDFKDLDSSSFLNKVKSSISSKKDEVEAMIPICTIKTPIPNVPTASFNIDVVAKFYTSGEVKVLIQNKGILGYEIKNGNFRFIKDLDNDADFIIGASVRCVAGLNFNLTSSKYRLMDVEFDAGIRASVSSTLHLYDEDGNDNQVNSNETYAVLYDISKDNPNVRVCGDVGLNWVFDINLNTSKTLLYKYGFSRSKQILSKKDQVFKNMTHLENFEFVKKCTRKNRDKINNTVNQGDNKIDKIILDRYSMVLIINNTCDFPIKSLPKNYEKSDLVYVCSDTSVVSVSKDGLLQANNIGNTKIKVMTKDEKHSAYLSVLVSTG